MTGRTTNICILRVSLPSRPEYADAGCSVLATATLWARGVVDHGISTRHVLSVRTCFGDDCVVLAKIPSHTLFGSFPPDGDWSSPPSTSVLHVDRRGIDGVAATVDDSRDITDDAEVPPFCLANSSSSSRTRAVNR